MNGGYKGDYRDDYMIEKKPDKTYKYRDYTD